MSTLAADPPVRDRCAGPGCSKRVAPRLVHKRLETDPFCSTACCRAWHGIPIATHSPQRLTEKPRATKWARRPDVDHGTIEGYRTDGCRCNDCKAAWKAREA